MDMAEFVLAAVAALAALAGVVAAFLAYRAGLAGGQAKGLILGEQVVEERNKKLLHTAEERAREMVSQAEQLKEALLRGAEAEASALKSRVEQAAEDQLRKRRDDLEAQARGVEERLRSKEQVLEKKGEAADRVRDELDLERKAADKVRQEVQARLEEAARTLDEARQRMEKAAGLSAEEARKALTLAIETEAKADAAKMVRQVEEQATQEAEARAKRIVGMAIQRFAGEYACERTISTVTLPSEEMKGRIIGREGRNIRALEMATGVDLIVDDTPETVVISGFDPTRREVARLALEALIEDGRIHPARIEETVEKARGQVERSVVEAGERACVELGLVGIHPEIQKLIGRLKYRTSYSQNQWQHSMEVAFLCGAMAAELGLNVKVARRAGLLHDIGKALTHEQDGSHAAIGADFARKYNESPEVVHCIRAHHLEEAPATMLAHLTLAADAISGARPGARRERLESYVQRLEDLERLCNGFPGVEKSFAVQAGREIRVLVESGKVTDDGAVVLSRDIARKIEADMTYPGQIKVTVIRETRATEVAK
jgi:ribonuclease Y